MRMDNSGWYTGINLPWWTQPNVCPGCGRCNVCGRPGNPQPSPMITWGNGSVELSPVEPTGITSSDPK